MVSLDIEKILDNYKDFPKKGILFKDIMPILSDPKIFKNLIEEMANSCIIKDCDAIIAVDARGFIFGSCIAFLTHKPIIAARKPGKLPGELISKSYTLEYGTNSLSLQKKAISKYKNFAIVDDLLATGGTVKCIEEIIYSEKKTITGLVVVIELINLLGKDKFDFEVESILKC